VIPRLLAAVLLVVVSVTASVVVTTLAVQRDAAPDPMPTPFDPAAAPVLLQQLDRRLVFRATLERGERPLGLHGVVSALPVQDGATVKPGDVLLEVEGRPLIALGLPFPLWRELGEGTQGRDVEALQTALADLGLLEGAAGGTFDARTRAAVEELFTAVGYPPPSVLPPTEVTPLGSEARLRLGGTRVGDVLAGARTPSLVTGEAALVVVDGGAIAHEARPGMSIRWVGSADGRQHELVVEFAEVDDGGASRIRVEGMDPGAVVDEVVVGSLILDATDGEVLAVPRTAVRTGPGGESFVEVLTGDSERVPVEVEVGFLGDELVEVRAAELSAGDRVVVGD
jgi:peptidoglycan hydrolase-like protein with peptidoglycan-binding domain